MTSAATNLINHPDEGPGIHVLVLGVSRYLHIKDGESPTEKGLASRFGQLSSPGRSAATFAAWLIEKHRHPTHALRSLRIVLSPQDDETLPQSVAALLQGDHRATRANVEAAIAAFKQDIMEQRDDIIIVYAAGHGVQVTKQGATLLLEDYAADGQLNELHAAVDMTGLHNGFNGSIYPDNQFWFIDACREDAPNLSRFEAMVAGIQIDVHPGSVASSPIFFATGPDAKAYGSTNGTSLFCQGLMHALDKAAASTNKDPLSRDWVISVNSLSGNLQQFVKELAEKYPGLKQDIDLGGKPNNALFHQLDGPPHIKLELDLNPTAAKPGECRLSDDQNGPVMLEGAGWPFKAAIPAGLYLISVKPEHPYKEATRIVQLEPPAMEKNISTEVKP